MRSAGSSPGPAASVRAASPAAVQVLGPASIPVIFTARSAPFANAVNSTSSTSGTSRAITVSVPPYRSLSRSPCSRACSSRSLRISRTEAGSRDRPSGAISSSSTVSGTSFTSTRMLSIRPASSLPPSSPDPRQHRSGRDQLLADPQSLRRNPQPQPQELREVENRQAEVGAEGAVDMALVALQIDLAERADSGNHLGLVINGILQQGVRHAEGGLSMADDQGPAAAPVAQGEVDRGRPDRRQEILKEAGLLLVLAPLTRPQDLAAVVGCHAQAAQGMGDALLDLRQAHVLYQHLDQMPDLHGASKLQPVLREGGVHVLRQVGILPQVGAGEIHVLETAA